MLKRDLLTQIGTVPSTRGAMRAGDLRPCCLVAWVTYAPPPAARRLRGGRGAAAPQALSDGTEGRVLGSVLPMAVQGAVHHLGPPPTVLLWRRRDSQVSTSNRHRYLSLFIHFFKWLSFHCGNRWEFLSCPSRQRRRHRQTNSTHANGANSSLARIEIFELFRDCWLDAEAQKYMARGDRVMPEEYSLGSWCEGTFTLPLADK